MDFEFTPVTIDPEVTFSIVKTENPDFLTESAKCTSAKKVRASTTTTLPPPTEYSKDNCFKHFDAVFRGASRDQYYNQVFCDFNPEMCQYSDCNEFCTNFNNLIEHINEVHTGPRKSYHEANTKPPSKVRREMEVPQGQKQKVYYTNLLLDVISGKPISNEISSEKLTTAEPQVPAEIQTFNDTLDVDIKEEWMNLGPDDDSQLNLPRNGGKVFPTTKKPCKRTVKTLPICKMEVKKPVRPETQSFRNPRLVQKTEIKVELEDTDDVDMKFDPLMNEDTKIETKYTNYPIKQEAAIPDDIKVFTENELSNENTQELGVEKINANDIEMRSPGSASNIIKEELQEPVYYDASFILQEGLKKKSGSSGKPFCCPVPGCSKGYKNKNGIKYHAMYGHSKRQEFPCHCGKIYTTGHGLKAHQKNHETPAEKIKRTSSRRQVKYETITNAMEDLTLTHPTVCTIYSLSSETNTGTAEAPPNDMITFASGDWGYKYNVQKQIFPIESKILATGIDYNMVVRGQTNPRTRKPRRKATQKTSFTSIPPSSFCYKSLKPEHNDFFFY